MKRTEQPLRKDTDLESIQPCEEKIEKTIHYAKKAFYEELYSQRISYFEFLYQQIKYMKKIWWTGQALLLVVFWFLLKEANSSFEIRRCMGILAPSFVIFIIPELWKNRTCDSVEIENTSLYTLRQIYSARMLLFALVDLLFLSIFYTVVYLSVKIEIKQIWIDFLLPMIVTCCICFRILCSQRMQSEVFAIVASVLWICVWTTVVLRDSVYHLISFPVWGLMICCAMLYFIYVIKKTLDEGSICWEETIIWN